MYIPKFNKETNLPKILSFIEAYPFANLISQIDGKPFATPLPFMVEQEKDDLYLLGHCAKDNPHGAHLLDQTHLIIFQEPHAFVTNADYIRASVPTWNYVAIHIYGEAEIISNDDEIRLLMTRTLGQFDEQALKSWPDLPDQRKTALLNGITCFKIKVDDVQAKYKLSQNKMKEERRRIANRLLNQDSTNDQNIGKMMKTLDP